MSNSLWLHGLYPARLLCPWDSPGKNTGMGCHFPTPRHLPNPGIESESLVSPALTGRFFTTCFLTCIQISQEADQVIWYSHLFQNFPQLIVIHTVKGFGIVRSYPMPPRPFTPKWSPKENAVFPEILATANRIREERLQSLWPRYFGSLPLASSEMLYLWPWPRAFLAQFHNFFKKEKKKKALPMPPSLVPLDSRLFPPPWLLLCWDKAVVFSPPPSPNRTLS